MSDDAEDPYVDQLLSEILAPYQGLVPADLMAEMSDFMGDVLATHPVGATLVDRLRPRAVPFQSGDAAKPGVAGEDQAVPAAKKHGGTG
jgi:hypothetical protein